MDTEVVNVKDGHKYNKFGEEVIECGLCHGPTTMSGTKRCDNCWELETRIHADPDLALKILRSINPTKNIVNFDDLNLGSRFRYQGMSDVWIKLDGIGCGKVAQQTDDMKTNRVWQSLCSAKEHESETLMVEFII